MGHHMQIEANFGSVNIVGGDNKRNQGSIMFSRRHSRGDVSTPYKIMLIGDGMVGKSAICKSYVRKSPFLTYHPTISETHEIVVRFHQKEYNVILWDTAGVEEWDGLRILDYCNTDCFILCYAINNKTSYTNVETRWVPELRKHSPNVPVLLVGTKTDIRTPANRWISDEEGAVLKSKVKAAGYIECSAKSVASIEGVFIQAVTIAEKYRESMDSRRCTIL